MKYTINNKEYDIIIERKKNKNTYIRVKEDLKIYITTNYLITNYQIKKLLDKNIVSIIKMINKQEKREEKKEQFYYLGKPYDVIWMPNVKVEFVADKIFAKDENTLNRWLVNDIKQKFADELERIYSLFEEKIPYPNLKIRTMKTRWGVCNRKNNNVTLNSELIKYSIDKLDYVIVHELSHFIHFNHSVSFWELVSKYCPDYKKIRKELKE